MKFKILICVFLLTFCSSACKQNSDITKQDSLKSDTLRFEQDYSSTNIQTAERALLTYISSIENQQHSGNKRYNYNFLFGLANARLADLYTYAGKTDLADNRYCAATKYIYLSAVSNKEEPKLYSKEELHMIVLHADSELRPGWRTSDIKDETLK